MMMLLLAALFGGLRAETKVVFAGDGVTDGAWGRSKGAVLAASARNLGDQNHHLGDSYVFTCAAWYQSQYPAAAINIQNRGIVGNTLDNLATRWQADVLDQSPDIISVLIGTEDVSQYISTGASGEFDIDSWTTKYRTMLTEARNANASVKLVLCAPFCGSKASYYAQRKPLLAQLAAKVEALATEFSGVYVPFDELFESEPSAGYFLWDGLTPSPVGYYEMFKMWVDKANNLVLGSTTPKTIGPSATQVSKGKRRVLYIGDSITDAGWGLAGGSALSVAQRDLTAIDHLLGHGYAMLCAAWYQSNYPEAEYEVLNRGISGNTLANLATRWQTDVLDQNPDVLSVLIGTNDIDQWLKGDRTAAFDYDAWETQYRSLLSQMLAKNPRVQLVLGAPFVGSRSSDYDLRKTMVATCASRVEEIASDMGAIYVPFDELFATLTENQPNTAYWIWDGIHPSPAGHFMMHQLWLEKAVGTVLADAKKEESTTLQRGGQFMDLLLPMEGSVAATESDWGTAAGTDSRGDWDGTLGRWKDNGIEDTEHSYWGGNIIKGTDGKYHIYVSGWPESTSKGHMAWSSASRVYHVTSDNVWGPYTYVSDIGAGHNSEIYKTGDHYVIYHIEPLGYYKSSTLGDTWESGEYVFDLRDRTLIAGENRETSLSNCTFAKREDGSFVMMDRGGGIWVSRDGLTDAWHQLTDASVYLTGGITNRGTLEDPVIWRDHLQYHMVVNDWQARYAYYYRSRDGLHWTKETGKAYTGQDPFAKHGDGTVERWHKYERPRVYQDEQGRAIRMNFAVIDCVKQCDLGSDTHSSKNINMPMTRQLLMEVVDNAVITPSTTSIRVLVKSEDGFNPSTDLNLSTLRFGSHDKVNYGNGFTYASSVAQGNDLVITFTGEAGESGITADEWAPKLLGQKTDGTVAFGYAKLPYVDYQPAMLSAVVPTIAADGTVQSISITNYGQAAAKATTVRVYNQSGTTLLAHGTTSALAAYSSEAVTLTKDAAAAAGYKSIQVRFYDGETLLNTENIPLTSILAAQTALQAKIDEANELYGDASLTNGKDALNQAIDAATPIAKCYDAATIEAQTTALAAAINTFKFANASPTNGLEITIDNPAMDDLTGWTLLRKDADATPGWKLNAKGTSYNGFDGTFLEYWVSQSNALGYANRASQTLTDMPAGRYRLRAKVIATRQNSTDAVTGVALYANSQRATCATDMDGTPQEFMVELTMTEAGSLEIGIDVAATTTANWVAWDNVSLKYFGTQDGDIVEDQPEPLSFDQQKVYRIKWNTNKYSKVYWRSPKYNTAGDAALHRTANRDEAAQFIIRSVAGAEGQFYLYDVVSHTFVVPSANASNGTAWTTSATTLGKTVITAADDCYSINSTAGGCANAYANDNNDGDVKNYTGGSQWLIEEAGENTATIGVNPQAVYRISHLNTKRNRYLASEPSAEGYLLTTNTDADKGDYALLPVSGRQGYYYIYNKEGYFVTPVAGNWTLSKTTPAEVKVTLNIDNMDAIPTTSVTFLLGEAMQYANPQNANGTELVKNYANKPLDKGNNWTLEPVAGGEAVLPLTQLGTAIPSVIRSAAAANVTLSYKATVGDAGFGTLVVPFRADVSGDVEAWQLTDVNAADAIVGELLSVIEANKPVLLKNAGTLELSGKAVSDDNLTNGLLTGVYATTQTVADSYVLQQQGDMVAFYRVVSGSEPTVQPFRAYLTAPATARQLTFAFGETTRVSTLDSIERRGANIVYDLTGRRVTIPARGFYIVNGKKVMVK